MVGDYAARRNFVAPGHPGVSRLSPGIRFGLISPEEIVRKSLAGHDFRRVEKWVQEVCWRSYWKGWLEMRPQVWTSWLERVRMLRESLPTEVLARARDVSVGRSGVAVILHLIRRPWDARLYPSAKAGFFPFWETTSRWLKQQFPPAQMTFL